MGAQQGKSVGDGGMGKIDIAPILRVMAFQARRRETAPCVFLFVVRLVTTEAIVLAGRTEQRIEVRRRGVARRALQSVMRPDKGKAIGYRRVLENGIVPRIDVVTFETGGRKTSACMLILVIQLVTRQAVLITRRRKNRTKIRRWVVA